MTDLDTRLRTLARDSLDRAATDAPVDADLAAVRARLATRPAPTPGLDRTWPWQRLAVAAALVLLVGSAVVLLASRGADEGLVAPVTEVGASTTVPPGPTTSMASTTTEAVLDRASQAVVEPSIVAPGSVVTITPTVAVAPRCPGAAAVYVAGESDVFGWIEPGETSLVLAPLVERDLDSCQMLESAEPSEVLIPTDLASGRYRICIDEDASASGCGIVEVDKGRSTTTASTTTVSTTTTTTVATPATATLPVGYVERVYVDEPPYFVLREIGPDGTIMGEAGDEAIAGLLRREVVAGDWTIRLLEEEQPYGRCDNRQVAASGPALAATPEADAIGLVRSLAATPEGVVVVGVDVCPDGAQWGDDGTRFELRRVDLRDGSTTVLHTRLPGEGDTFFEDQDVVYAGGEFVVESVSPDGAVVAVAEPYTTEDTRYHVFDAVTGGDPVELGSSCDDPGDIVGPPQFVGAGLVVVARECSPIDTAIGDLVVELVSLATLEPVWSVDVRSVAIDSYSHTVSLSATAVDGQVWALVSGSPGVEQPITAAAVTEDVEQPLPVASIVAFTPEELIEPWDPYPA